jgi:exodeoxyribonuclease VII small subunit
MSKQRPKFEDAMARLEQIVAQIEKGDVPLEESIEKYAEGIAMIETCRAILDSAEKRIQLLAKGPGQTLSADGELDEPAGEA